MQDFVPWFFLSPPPHPPPPPPPPPPPDKIDNDYLMEFNSSLSRIMSNRNAHDLIGGDFNCGDIEWSHMKVPQGVQKRQSQQQLLDIIGETVLLKS